MTYDLSVFDLHVSPDTNWDRIEALGQLIVKEKPRSIIFGGDFASLDSCSTYDDPPRFTLHEDMEAVRYAYSLIFDPMLEWNRRQESHKHRPYRPRTVWLEGNHEERERRLRKADPYRYSSLVDVQAMIAPTAYWQEKYEYGEVANVNGINYTHCPLSKIGRPMGYTTVARQTNGHLIYGHTHEMRMTPVPQVDTNNSVRMILNAPAYLEQDSKEHYNEKSTTGWVYGLLKVRPQGPTRPFSYDYWTTEEVIEQYL